MLAIVTMNNIERRNFYGEGNYDPQVNLLAPPSGIVGDVLAPNLYVKANLNNSGTHRCDNVTTINGKQPTMSIADETLICCHYNPEYDSYLAPFKIVGDKLHILCSSFPLHQKVITDAPRNLIDSNEVRELDKD